MKEHFNLKEIFGHPITIYKFGKYRLPFGIGLMRIFVGVVTFLVMLVFRKFFLAFDEIMRGLSLLLFAGIPYFLSGYLVKKTYEGKKIHNYLWDFGWYVVNIYWGKKKFCNDEVVEYLDCPKIKIEQIKLEKERKQHATTKRVSRRSQKLNVNTEGGHSRTIQS
ncbi:TcpE family conjugal transfer membrane protein [Bacillus thuringiensis]|uniref:TcpE family conjugal transfer membrane protein n=1 Tax=Bacillus thuringiensis TaxID=1428 RepID=UPI003CFD79B7